MDRVWVNSKWLTSDNTKTEKWKPESGKDKALWGLCACGETIYEGDAVGMRGDHVQVVCYACWLEGKILEAHLDCVGLRLPGVTLSN
jgi:hypothetical protein